MSKKWDIPKCHRTVRPLISKINGLNILLESHPSLCLLTGPITSVRTSDDQTSNHRLNNNSRKYSSKRSIGGSDSTSYKAVAKCIGSSEEEKEEVLTIDQPSAKTTIPRDIRTIPRSPELLAFYKPQVTPEIWRHYQALYTTFFNFLQQSYVPKDELSGLKRLSAIKLAQSMSMADGAYGIECWLDCNEMVSPYRQLMVASYGIYCLCKEISSCRDILPVLMLVCLEIKAEDFCLILVKAFLSERKSRIPCCVASDKGFSFVLELIGSSFHDKILPLLVDTDIQSLPLSSLASKPSFNDSQFQHAIQLLLQFRKKIKQHNDSVDLTLRSSENITWLCKGCISKHHKVDHCKQLIDLIPPSGSLKDLRKLLELRIASSGDAVLGFSLFRFLTAGPGRTMAVQFLHAFEVFKELTEGILIQHPSVAQSMCQLYRATLIEYNEDKDIPVIEKWCSLISTKCDRMIQEQDHSGSSIYVPSSDIPSSSPSLMVRYLESTPRNADKGYDLSEKKSPSSMVLSEPLCSSPFSSYKEETYRRSPLCLSCTSEKDSSYLETNFYHKTGQENFVSQKTPLARDLHFNNSMTSISSTINSRDMSGSPRIHSRKRSHLLRSSPEYGLSLKRLSNEEGIEEDDLSFRNLSKVRIYSSPSVVSPIIKKLRKSNEPIFQRMIKSNTNYLESPSKHTTTTRSSSRCVLQDSLNGLNARVRQPRRTQFVEGEFSLMSDDDLCMI